MIAPAPVWIPSREHLEESNLAELMRRLGVSTYDALLALSADAPDRFWAASLEHLDLRFDNPPTAFVDQSAGKPWPRFFPGGRINFARACLRPPSTPEGGQRPALIWEDEGGRGGSLSYDRLGARVLRVAAGLRRRGVGFGDRVGLLMPNVPEAVIAFLAVGCLGAVTVPLYSGFGPDAAAVRLRDAEASALIIADGFVRRGKPVELGATASALMASVTSLKQLVVVDVIGKSMPPAPHTRWDDLEREAADPSLPVDTAASDPCMLIYTSGTTGKPKGTVHLHAGFPLRVSQDAAYLFDFRPGDRLFWMSDIGWMVGPFSIIASLMLKGTLVLYDGAPDRPDHGRLRAIAGRHGVTHFGSSPSAIRALAANQESALAPAANALRILITAGEIIDEDAFGWYYGRFGAGRLPVINYTGGTEVSGAILSNAVMRPIRASRFNSVAPGVRAGVVDPDGKPVVGTPGELAIFEPFVGMTAGFWRAPERYLDAYWSRVPDLWMHGDLAIQESDGQFALLGRSDDVMKISGKRIGPSEVEAIVADGRLVDEAVAFSVPDPLSGEALVLMVVANPKAQDDLAARTSAVIVERLGKAFRPKAVLRVPRLPKTRNGKVVRRLARNAWLGEAAGNLDGIEDPAIFGELAHAARTLNSQSRSKDS